MWRRSCSERHIHHFSTAPARRMQRARSMAGACCRGSTPGTAGIQAWPTKVSVAWGSHRSSCQAAVISARCAALSCSAAATLRHSAGRPACSASRVVPSAARAAAASDAATLFASGPLHAKSELGHMCHPPRALRLCLTRQPCLRAVPCTPRAKSPCTLVAESHCAVHYDRRQTR